MNNSGEGAPSVQILRASPDDAPSIASVLLGAFAEYKELYTDGAFAATVLTSEHIAGRMSQGPTWVALRNGAIVGTVSALPTGDALYVRSMAVLHEARGQGIGDLLLRELEAFATSSDYKRLFLSTTPFLTRAIKLYEHAGFRREAEGPHDLFGTPLFTMVKEMATGRQTPGD